VSATLGLRVRFLAVVLILAVAAVAAGFLTLSRLRAAQEDKAATAPARPVHVARKPSKPGPVSLAKATPKPVTPAPNPAGKGLPAEVAAQLAANHVVVISLYAPKAKVETTAMKEAQSGAALAGAAFTAVDVSTSAVDGLNRRYGVIQDPAVLVLRPPTGDLVVRIDGFADRDTVAQAAANAAS
jgi:hypothetical protein